MKPRNAQEAKRARDQKVRQLRRRQNLRLVAALFFLAALVAILVLIYNSSYWRIKKIETNSGKHFSAQEIKAIAKVPPDTSLLKFPGDLIGSRISQNPWVARVTFSRRLPSTLIIKVEERQPFAVINQGGVYYLIDRSGFVITRWRRVHNFQVPVINDLDLDEIEVGHKHRSELLRTVIDILSNLPKLLKDSVVSVSIPDLSKLTLYTGDNLEIVYGPAKQMAKKNAVIEKIIESGDEKIIYINVTMPESPVVRKVRLAPKK